MRDGTAGTTGGRHGPRAGRLLAAALATAALAGGAGAARAATYQVLYSFQGLDGSGPVGQKLAVDASGALYGCTQKGGAGGHGTVWKLRPPPHPYPLRRPWKLAVLADVTADFDCIGALLDGTGRLFTLGLRHVYLVTPGRPDPFRPVAQSFSGEAAFTSNALADFTLGPQGQIVVADPSGDRLIQAAQAVRGGVRNGIWQQRTLYQFGTNDGAAFPVFLTTGADGTIYGATLAEGPAYWSPDGSVSGYLFRRSPGQGGVTFLTSVPSADAYPVGMTVDGTGDVYGATSNYADTLWSFDNVGPPMKQGVFEWGPGDPLTIIAPFSEVVGIPVEHPPILGSDGALYGVARGATTLGILGSVYRVDTSSGQLTIVHAFAGGTDGDDPQTPLVPGPGGWLYGTAWEGGAHGQGLVFRVHP